MTTATATLTIIRTAATTAAEPFALVSLPAIRTPSGRPTPTDPPVAPCGRCETLAGPPHNGCKRPGRRSGEKWGYEALLCLKCWRSCNKKGEWQRLKVQYEPKVVIISAPGLLPVPAEFTLITETAGPVLVTPEVLDQARRRHVAKHHGLTAADLDLIARERTRREWAAPVMAREPHRSFHAPEVAPVDRRREDARQAVQDALIDARAAEARRRRAIAARGTAGLPGALAVGRVVQA